MKKLVFLIITVIFIIPAFAQVGINNSSPDSSAVLDLQSNSNNQGLLVPRLSSDQIAAISLPAKGLLAYNTDLDLFCFYDGSNWYSLRTFRQILNWGDLDPQQDMDADIYAGKNMGIGYSGANSKMSLNGNISVGANEAAPVSGAFIAGQVRIGSNVGVKKLEVDGEIHSTNNIDTDGKIKENGHDLLPAGSIIMWSGATIPLGWKLCNGSNGTPDLRGKFIMGYGSHNETTLKHDGSISSVVVNPSIGATGGYDKVAIDTTQMPKHIHTMGSAGNHSHPIDGSYEEIDANGAGGNPGFTQGSTHNTDYAGVHTHTLNSNGDNQAHENRPPYYVLAFIMKE